MNGMDDSVALKFICLLCDSFEFKEGHSSEDKALLSLLCLKRQRLMTKVYPNSQDVVRDTDSKEKFWANSAKSYLSEVE